MVWSWILKILAEYGIIQFIERIFKIKKADDKVIDSYLNRIKQLREDKISLRDQLEEQKILSEMDKIKVTKTLKKRNISVKKVISKYNKPLNIIIISFTSQKIKKGKYYASKSFIADELEKYDKKWLGGDICIIPPQKVKDLDIKNKKDLQTWFEKDVLKDRYCKVKLLALVDLRNNVFWENYLPYEQKEAFHKTIGDVLTIDDILTSKEQDYLSISEYIKEGDLFWLCSYRLDEFELQNLKEHQHKIEKELGNPNLNKLTSDKIEKELNEVLKDYFPNFKEITKVIIQEAQYWKRKLE